MVVMGWSWTSGVRTHQLLLIGVVVGMIAVLVAGVTLLSAVLPDYRGAVQLRNPVPLDEEFANLNRVSHWPADWINAVCEPPLYQTPKLGAIASRDEYRVLRVTDQVRRRRGLSHDLSFS